MAKHKIKPMLKQYQQAAIHGQSPPMPTKKTRPNKSHAIIKNLKALAGNSVLVANPWQAELKAAAKRLEWLELLVTGITGKERNTIAKLLRREKSLEKMVKLRDMKLGDHKDIITNLKQKHKSEVKELLAQNKREVDWIKRKKLEVLPEIREQIEREFIDKMLTSKGVNAGENAMQMLQRQLQYQSRQDGKWHQVYIGGSGTSY